MLSFTCLLLSSLPRGASTPDPTTPACHIYRPRSCGEGQLFPMSPHLPAAGTLRTCKSEACRELGLLLRERDGTGQDSISPCTVESCPGPRRAKHSWSSPAAVGLLRAPGDVKRVCGIRKTDVLWHRVRLPVRYGRRSRRGKKACRYQK